MRMFKVTDYVAMENPTPGVAYRPEILEAAHNAKDIGGMFGLLPAGTRVPYPYHRKRESIIIVISGEATEIIEGEEIPIAAGDVLYIPAGERHATINNSNKDFRYLEFFTCPPVAADFVEVK